MNRTIFNCLAGAVVLAAASICAGKVIYVDAGERKSLKPVQAETIRRSKRVLQCLSA